MLKPNPYPLINAVLAKGVKYNAESYVSYPGSMAILRNAERLLRELQEIGLLPDLREDELVLWLLRESPLTEGERTIIHTYAFDLDYY